MYGRSGASERRNVNERTYASEHTRTHRQDRPQMRARSKVVHAQPRDQNDVIES